MSPGERVDASNSMQAPKINNAAFMHSLCCCGAAVPFIRQETSQDVDMIHVNTHVHTIHTNSYLLHTYIWILRNVE